MSRAATQNARLIGAGLLLVAWGKENHGATLSSWLDLVKALYLSQYILHSWPT
jgi:hypothetical protein